MPGIRIDSGVREGDRVSVHYDALLAKVIATAETRDTAVARIVQALRRFPILGIRTNVPFLIRVLESDAFRRGTVHTGFLDGEGAALASAEAEAPPEFLRAVIDVADQEQAARNRGGSPTSAASDPWSGVAGSWSVR